jgi:hypothetical protein
MNSRAGVIVALVVALVVLTVPFWYALGQRVTGRSQAAPDIPKPTNAENCVENNMRARHMQVIDEWRDAVVREGQRVYPSQDHRDPHTGEPVEYVMSLTETCLLKCHSTEENPKTDEAGNVLSVQQRFCNECHQFANIRPNCWDCHLEGSP